MNYGVSMSKSPCFYLNKKINFNKNEIKAKLDNITQVLREMNFGFQSYKSQKFKMKLW